MRRHIVLFFLFFVALNLNGAYATPMPAYKLPKKTMTFVGDSIGMGLSASRASRAFVGRLQHPYRLPTLFIRNHSVPGMSMGGKFLFIGPLDSYQSADMNVDVVYIALGTNDYVLNVSEEAFRGAWKNLFATLKAQIPLTKRFICQTPLWRASEEVKNKAGFVLENYRQMIREECVAGGGIIIEGIDLIPHDVRHFPDGLHPSDLGYWEYAKNVKFPLRQALWPGL